MFTLGRPIASKGMHTATQRSCFEVVYMPTRAHGYLHTVLYVLLYSTVPCVLYYSLIAVIVITLHLICIVGISKIRTFLSYGHCPVPRCPFKGGSTVLVYK